MNEIPSQEQAILSTLSPAMRRALLAAHPAPPEPEWDNPADYCPGHESLAGADMGVTVHCEEGRVCPAAQAAYLNDRAEDPDRLVVTRSDHVTLGTVVALIGRGLIGTLKYGAQNYHELTEQGLCVLHALKALPAEEQGPAAGYTPAQRIRARHASQHAVQAATHAAAHGRYPQRSAEGMAALLDYVADSGPTSPATLHALANALRDC